MKKIISIFICILLIMPVNPSCKKEDSADIRDQFVGTWTGIFCFARIPTEYNTTVVITKSSANSNQIILKEQGGIFNTRTATVSYSSYSYEGLYISVHISGIYPDISGIYAGEGLINDNIINESGTITSNGGFFEGDLGTWTRHLKRK
jgi:hypothetical protein